MADSTALQAEEKAFDLELEEVLVKFLAEHSHLRASPPPSCCPTVSSLCARQNRAHPPAGHPRRLFHSPSASPASIPASPAVAPPPPPRNSCRGRKRGSYNCRKCGLPKRGHVCADAEKMLNAKRRLEDLTVTEHEEEEEDSALAVPVRQELLVPYNSDNLQERQHQESSLWFPSVRLFAKTSACHESFQAVSKPDSVNLPSSSTNSCSSNDRFRRRFASHVIAETGSPDADCISANSSDVCPKQGGDQQELPLLCMVKIMSHLSPLDLVSASIVCRRWSQSAEYVWEAVREASLSIGGDMLSRDERGDFIPYILRKCSNLRQLTFRICGQLNDRMLQRIATFSHQLRSLEVVLRPGGVNATSGEGVKFLARQCRFLTSLKMEGCRRITEVELSSTRLSALWLLGCTHLKYMFLHCPKLLELCLDVVPALHEENLQGENVDTLAVIMKNLGHTAKGLQRVHIASPWLHDRVVAALLGSGLKFLSMLSLTLGSGITDGSVAVIAFHCQNIELLDLSGSSITDMGLELICRSFSRTLSKLLVALCHRISNAGLEAAVSRLPVLCLLDCGRVMVDEGCANMDFSIEGLEDAESRTVLRLQHLHLRKLSLSGCSGLQMLKLDCPELVDLNLIGCDKLDPGRLQLSCPSLKDVHVDKDRAGLLHEIQNQALFGPPLLHQQADGCGKRVHAPRPTGASAVAGIAP